MQIEQTPLAGVLVITPRRFGDDRGFFSESWNRRTLTEAGVTLPEFVQDNHSLSREIGTVRGCISNRRPMRRANWCAAGAARCLMLRWIFALAQRPTGNGLARS